MDEMRELSKLVTNDSPRRIISSIFKIDMPITGGWGYDFESACIIDKNDPIIPKGDFFNGVRIEKEFVEKRIYTEMVVSRETHEKYFGIKWELDKQTMIKNGDKPYDVLVYSVIGFTREIWDELTSRFEEIKESGNVELLEELNAYRASKACRFKREFYFEISSFYGQPVNFQELMKSMQKK